MLKADRLRALLRYDPDTGRWTWLVNHGRWGRIPAGIGTGTTNTHGYRVIRVDGRNYLCHRLAFLYMTGEWPREEVDHRDMDRSNDRWVNLREATKSENSMNRSVQANTKSRRKGVQWMEANKKWRAYIREDRKFRHLGLFNTIDEASTAYAEAANRLHGEFARTH